MNSLVPLSLLLSWWRNWLDFLWLVFAFQINTLDGWFMLLCGRNEDVLSRDPITRHHSLLPFNFRAVIMLLIRCALSKRALYNSYDTADCHIVIIFLNMANYNFFPTPFNLHAIEVPSHIWPSIYQVFDKVSGIVFQAVLKKHRNDLLCRAIEIVFTLLFLCAVCLRDQLNGLMIGQKGHSIKIKSEGLYLPLFQFENIESTLQQSVANFLSFFGSKCARQGAFAMSIFKSTKHFLHLRCPILFGVFLL